MSGFLPFIGNFEVLFTFIVIWPIVALIGGSIGTFLAPLLVLLHKKIMGRHMTYGVEVVHKSEKFKRTFQGFFAGLMAINFSLLISDYDNVRRLLITDMWYGMGMESLPQLISFIVGLTFTLIISFALFSALWAVSDAGIVFSNKNVIEKRGKEKPIMGQSIGSWFNYLLKGYAGIGVAVAYFELIFLFYQTGGLGSLNPFVDFVNLYLFLGYFILLPIFTIPAIVVIDVFRDWRVEYVKKFAAKLGITKKVTITLQEVKDT